MTETETGKETGQIEKKREEKYDKKLQPRPRKSTSLFRRQGDDDHKKDIMFEGGGETWTIDSSIEKDDAPKKL